MQRPTLPPFLRAPQPTSGARGSLREGGAGVAGILMAYGTYFDGGGARAHPTQSSKSTLPDAYGFMLSRD